MGLESNEYEEWFLGFDHDDVFILGHVHKYLLDFSPLWTFGMSAIKLSVTIRKEIYNNFRHSKVLHGRMAFKWPKIGFYLAKIWERYYT